MRNKFGDKPIGIYINLYVQPHRIPSEAWKEMYDESLKIVRFAPFMDSYRPEGSDHFYAVRTAHIDNLYGSGYGGWKTHGSMSTGSNMDCFCLYDNIDYYRALASNDEYSHHIINDLLTELGPHGYVQIWDGATNGQDAHIYLLAVACLVCDRFPDAAYVCGDISCEQLEYVQKWLSLGLELPIKRPLRIRPAGLIAALRKAGIPENELLFYFFYFNLCRLNKELGAKLYKAVGRKLIREHYLDELKPYEDENGNVFIWACVIREYLSLGLDFEMLCRMVMTDIDGCHYPPESFLRMLLDMKLHLANKPGYDDAEGIIYDTSQIPELTPVPGGLRARNANAYIPLAEIEGTFSEVLGTPFSAADALPDYNLASPTGIILTDTQKVIKRFMEPQTRELYDVNSKNELMNYMHLSTVKPTLRQEVIDFFRTIQSNYEAPYHVLSMDTAGRRDWFDRNYDILITENMEREMFLRCNNDEYIRPFIALYAYKGDPLFRHVALHNAVFRHDFWELAGNEL